MSPGSEALPQSEDYDLKQCHQGAIKVSGLSSADNPKHKMGCSCWNLLRRIRSRMIEKNEARMARLRNEEIERFLKAEQVRLRNETKMLLLGLSDSTRPLMKRLELDYDETQAHGQRKKFRGAARSEMVFSMQELMRAMELLEMSFDTRGLGKCIETVLMQSLPLKDQEVEDFPFRLGPAIMQLRDDPGAQRCLTESELRGDYWTMNYSYYLAAAERIAEPGYVPTDEDVLRSRDWRVGIRETIFVVGNVTRRIFELGGCSTERRKWIHIFDDIDLIVFPIDLSLYDETLLEDATVSRMQETIVLFESVVRSSWLSQSDVVLFFSNMDEFKKKLQNNPLNVHFPDYTGTDYEQAFDYILHRFSSLNPFGTRQIYSHIWGSTRPSPFSFLMAVANDSLIARLLHIPKIRSGDFQVHAGEAGN